MLRIGSTTARRLSLKRGRTSWRWSSAAAPETAERTEEGDSPPKSFPGAQNRTIEWWHPPSNSSKASKSSAKPAPTAAPTSDPDLHLGTGLVAQHALASIVGTQETSVALSTVVPGDHFTVDFWPLQAGWGQIPRNRGRSDQVDILGSRLIDRAIRPLLASSAHVHCNLQAVDPITTSYYQAIALAINTTAAALVSAGFLREPLAARAVQVWQQEDNGRLVLSTTTEPSDSSTLVGELLYAGTRQGTLLLDWTRHQTLRRHAPPEVWWSDALEEVHQSLDPLLNTIQQVPSANDDTRDNNEAYWRHALGLPVDDPTPPSMPASLSSLEDLVESAFQYCHLQLHDAALQVFGVTPGEPATDLDAAVRVYQGGALLSKKHRARREQTLWHEIQRLVEVWVEIHPEAEAQRDLVGERVADRLLRRAMAEAAVLHGRRADGRLSSTVRPLRLQAPALPATVHGSALFARGETQVLCTATLGPPRDGLIAPAVPWPHPSRRPKASDKKESTSYYDTLPVGSLRFLRTQESSLQDRAVPSVDDDEVAMYDLDDVQRVFLQYQFEGYATGSAPQPRQAKLRRSKGHGALAERAILSSIPRDFSYAVRLTCEVTDSNGSSSMASVCGATLAMLDAGIDLVDHVVGVSVGLAADDQQRQRLLLDITGTEDHYGMMDFKVAGSRSAVTAMQLDVKQPVPVATISEALELAQQGRRSILEEMNVQADMQPRAPPKASSPKVEVVVYDPNRKRDIVGPGGVVLRQLEDRYDVTVDLSQEGRCLLFGTSHEMVSKAKSTVMDLVADIVPGQKYEGTIIEVKDFGCIVELLRSKEGLLHVSELTNHEEAKDHPGGITGFVNQHMKVGQQVEVLCLDVDHVQGSIKLSRRALLEQQQSREA